MLTNPARAASENEPTGEWAPNSVCLLDTVPEQAFDELVQLTADLCQAPIGMITLLDETRQVIKACYGLEAKEVPRTDSFCTHTVAQEGLFIVPDTHEDARFCRNPYVTGESAIRFYAGYPLSAWNGPKFGALCVLDTVPRVLTTHQQHAIRVLAQQVLARMELKTHILALDVAMLESKRIARELELSNTRFRAFMDATPAAAFMKDESGRMIYCNRALTERYNAIPEDWIGKNDFEIWPHAFAENDRNSDVEALQGNRLVHVVHESPVEDGPTLVWDVYKFPFEDAAGRRFLAGIAMDVTKERSVEIELRRSQQQLRELNIKLQKLSMTDGLTSIKNRRGLEESLEREFARSRSLNAPLSLLMLDVDHFKLYNDSFGHVAGDQVLQRIAVLMKEQTRQTDILARYGGEEFIALLPDTEAAEACMIATRLCEQIAGDRWKHRPITVSVGVGELRPHILQPSAFVNAIDEALYVAKRNGRNRVCLAAQTPAAPTMSSGISISLPA